MSASPYRPPTQLAMHELNEMIRETGRIHFIAQEPNYYLKRTSPVPRPKQRIWSQPIPFLLAPTQQTSVISIRKGRELKNLYNRYNKRAESTTLVSATKDRECEICEKRLGRGAWQVVMSSRISDDNMAPSTTTHDGVINQSRKLDFEPAGAALRWES